MSEKSRSILKSYFETGDRPTQQQFADLIDSIINTTSDNITVDSVSKNIGLGTEMPRTRLDTGTGLLSGAANDYLRAQQSLSGGGTVAWAGPGSIDGLSWTSRFLATSIGPIDTFAEGYIVIDMPLADIPASNVYDGADRVLGTDGAIVLNNNEALYAVHTVGGLSTEVELRIEHQDTSFYAPSNWILIAVVNGDDGSIKLGIGGAIAPGETNDSGGGGGDSGWTYDDVNGLVTNETDNIGIGTLTPGQKLTVVGGEIRHAYSDPSTGYLEMYNSDPFSIINHVGSNDLYIRRNGNDIMTFDVSDNVGIGTISPNRKLTVVGGAIRHASSSLQTDYIEMFHDGINSNVNHVGVGNINFGSNGTSWMTLDGSNTDLFNGPRLTVSGGTIRALNSVDATNYMDMFTGFSSSYIRHYGSGSLYLSTDGATLMLENSSNKRVGINTFTPESDLHILQTAGGSNNGIRLQNNTDIYNIMNSGGYLYLTINNTIGAIIYPDGSYNTISDQRFKKDIEGLGKTLQKVKKLNPVSFSLKHLKDAKKSIGFIAQEVQALFPEAVNKAKSLEEGGEDILSISYSDFGPIAIKAIQEQQILIEKQAGQIKRLQGKVSTIERKLKN